MPETHPAHSSDAMPSVPADPGAGLETELESNARVQRVIRTRSDRGPLAQTDSHDTRRSRRLLTMLLLLGVPFTLTSVLFFGPASSAQDSPTNRVPCGEAGDDFKLLCLAFEALDKYFVDGVVVEDLAAAAEKGVVDAGFAERTTVAPACALPAPEFEGMCAEIDRVQDTAGAALAATDAMLASLNEPRTRRLTPAAFTFTERSLASAVYRIGIGIESALLGTDGNPCTTPSDRCRLQILEVFAKSPAAAAGLMAGDTIVEYVEVVADSECADLRRLDFGHAAGDTVSVSILRNGVALAFELVTARIVDPVVFSQIVDGNVGYVQLDLFSDGSAQKFLTHLNRLVEAGAEAIVVDLRNNPGGFLDETEHLSGYFLKKSEIISRTVSVHHEHSVRAKRDGVASDAVALPMVVVVNGRSASASELFALAMRGNDRAKIVGATTFGKSTGQQTFKAVADDGSLLGAIMLTALRYVGPRGTSPEGGIQPDLVESISDCAHPIGVVRQSLSALDPPGGSGALIDSTPGSPDYTPTPVTPDTDTTPEPALDPDTDTDTTPEPEPDPDTDTDTTSEPDADTDTDATPEPEPEPGPEPSTEPEPEVDPEPELDPEPDPEPELDPEPDPEPDTDTTPEPEPEPEPDTDTDTDTAPEPDPSTDTTPEPEPEPDPEPSTDTDPAPERDPSKHFSDISDTRFIEAINWLAAQRITTGCGPDTYCPDMPVTRGQMAAFLSRALQLPAADRDYFSDDNDSTFEDDINRLRHAGITTGCAADKFCADQPVTRGQMAAFLNRALQLPAADRDYFSDDNDSTFEDDINRLRYAGITTGCAADKFCADQPVSRGQTAAFLYRARDLIAATGQQTP